MSTSTELKEDASLVDQECCPSFHPEKWDGRSLTWKNKNFIKASMPAFFHIPFPGMISRKVTKLMKEAEENQALPEDKEEILLLFHDPHMFRSDMYLSVTKEIPNALEVKISGNFLCKVFDGPYNAIPRFMKEMDKYVVEKGKAVKNYFVHYAYCPACAEKQGHNYMVFFAEI